MLQRFMREEEGATMVIVSTLGQSLKGAFIRTNTGVTNANAADASATAGGPVATP
jgi:Flp pilus assembly pilin Flp